MQMKEREHFKLHSKQAQHLWEVQTADWEQSFGVEGLHKLNVAMITLSGVQFGVCADQKAVWSLFHASILLWHKKMYCDTVRLIVTHVKHKYWNKHVAVCVLLYSWQIKT